MNSEVVIKVTHAYLDKALGTNLILDVSVKHKSKLNSSRFLHNSYISGVFIPYPMPNISKILFDINRVVFAKVPG